MIEVLRAGIQTSVQDLGCIGSMHLGLSRGGAADFRSLKMANQLMGVALSQPCLECTLFGPSLKFKQTMLVVVAGAHTDIHIDNQTMPMHTRLLVRKGQVLTIGSIIGGCRSYVAFSQLLDIDRINGSASTFISIGLGGVNGRALKTGDKLNFKQRSEKPSQTAFCPDLTKTQWLDRIRPEENVSSGSKRYSIRIFVGVDADLLDKQQWQTFLASNFEVCQDSNRMGIRLAVKSGDLQHQLQIVSSPMMCGTIQLPPDGQPIIAHVEAQTIGGYPRIGQVVASDLACLGQLKAGDRVNFVLIDS
jgi:biotin-dependent carboxylase-like uncharacterized protein